MNFIFTLGVHPATLAPTQVEARRSGVLAKQLLRDSLRQKVSGIRLTANLAKIQVFRTVSLLYPKVLDIYVSYLS